jgi:hypothetical protein
MLLWFMMFILALRPGMLTGKHLYFVLRGSWKSDTFPMVVIFAGTRIFTAKLRANALLISYS